MKNIIKKGLILSLFNLEMLTPVMCQITLDSIETKETALIFNEHAYLSIENPLLKQQIKSLEELNQLYVNTDSIQKEEINIYKEKAASDAKKIQYLKSFQKKSVLGFSVGGIVLFIIGLIL